MTESKTGFVLEIWHASKIRIQSGSLKTYLHMLKDAPEEVARFNGHSACVLCIGTPLSFDQDASGRITNVKFDIPTPSHDEFEDSTIVNWNPSTRAGGCGYGFAQRSCRLGCRVYTREDDVITLGVLKVGSEINHAVEEQPDGRVKATLISIYE
jgi:hypothetical protein